MARFFKVEELEAKKRALIAESDVCRRALAVDLQNLRVHGANLKSKVSVVKRLEPFLALGAALAGAVPRRPAPRPRTLIGRLLRVWGFYKMLAPLLEVFLERRLRRTGLTGQARSRSRAPAE